MDYDNYLGKRAVKVKRRKRATKRATKMERREKAAKMEQINSKRRIAERQSNPPTHQELVYEEYAFDGVSDILWEEWMRRNDWRFDGEYYP